MTAAFALQQPEERRRNKRFPIAMDLSYRIQGRKQEGRGGTVNMSSHGLLFRKAPEGDNLVGKIIQMRLDWPVLLEGVTPMLLAVQGKIMRVDERGCAVKFYSVQFKTRRASVRI